MTTAKTPTPANDPDEWTARDLYIKRLDLLEREIRRQRHLLVDHDMQRRNMRTWDAIRSRHDLKARRFADHKHVIREMIEDLRFDVDVLVQDFRRFFSSSENERRPELPRGRRSA